MHKTFSEIAQKVHTYSEKFNKNINKSNKVHKSSKTLIRKFEKLFKTNKNFRNFYKTFTDYWKKSIKKDIKIEQLIKNCLKSFGK